MFDFNFDKKEKLCRLCAYGQRMRNGKYYCKVTGKESDFYAYCPDFKISALKDDKIQRRYSKRADALLIAEIIAITFMILYNIFHFDDSFFVAVIAIIVIAAVIYQNIYPQKIISDIGLFPYVYLLVAGNVLLNKNGYGQAEVLIVKQQIYKLLGRRKIALANQIFKNDSRRLNDFSKYAKRLNDKEKQFIFSMACQIFVYDNLENFKSSKLLSDVADFLQIDKFVAEQIMDKYYEKEKLYRQQEKEKQQQRKKYSENKSKNNNTHQSGRRVYSFSYSKYYSVLGLNSNASDEQIKKKFKKLALKYHPDRFVGASETEQQAALEKFKEISQAYNYLKNLRGF